MPHFPLSVLIWLLIGAGAVVLALAVAGGRRARAQMDCARHRRRGVFAVVVAFFRRFFFRRFFRGFYPVGRLMQDLGYWILNDVIWRKTNPMPNFRGVRFTNATETLIWAAKSSDSRKVFQHALMKAENGGKQMRNDDWCFPLCGGRERLRDGAARKLGRRAIGIEREQKYIAAAARAAQNPRLRSGNPARNASPAPRADARDSAARSRPPRPKTVSFCAEKGRPKFCKAARFAATVTKDRSIPSPRKSKICPPATAGCFGESKKGRRLVLLDRLRAVCRAEAAPV